MADLPKVVSSAEIELGDFVMRVHMLDNGMRVIDAEDMERLFSSEVVINEQQADELAKAIKGLTSPPK